MQNETFDFAFVIFLFFRTWGFTDVCYKEQVPLQAESGGITSLVSKRYWANLCLVFEITIGFLITSLHFEVVLLQLFTSIQFV